MKTSYEFHQKDSEATRTLSMTFGSDPMALAVFERLRMLRKERHWRHWRPDGRIVDFYASPPDGGESRKFELRVQRAVVYLFREKPAISDDFWEEVSKAVLSDALIAEREYAPLTDVLAEQANRIEQLTGNMTKLRDFVREQQDQIGNCLDRLEALEEFEAKVRRGQVAT